ncbi:MAG: DUF3515 domain-containing protein [Mycobacterium sp.]|nr:DUF3515 domain-containing protein [Mycobacterium sp.]
MNSQSDGPPRPLLIAALVVAVGAVVAVLILATVTQRSRAPEPVAIASAPAPRADSPECRELTSALPDKLGEYSRAPVREPAPAGTAGWRPDDGGEALILRCGLDRPLTFVVGAPVQMVDAVQWFKVTDEADDSRSTWFAVDRPVYVALTLPAGSGPTPIQSISTVLSDVLPATAPDPAPAR